MSPSSVFYVLFFNIFSFLFPEKSFNPYLSGCNSSCPLDWLSCLFGCYFYLEIRLYNNKRCVKVVFKNIELQVPCPVLAEIYNICHSLLWDFRFISFPILTFTTNTDFSFLVSKWATKETFVISQANNFHHVCYLPRRD